MIARLLIAGVAIGALAAGGAVAKTSHHSHHAKGHGMSGAAETYAAPAAPIPYADVDHYLHASRAERRSMETAAANSNAMTAAQPAAAETSAPASTESQPAAAPSATESQPPAATPPASTTQPPAAMPPSTPPPTEATPPK